MRQAEPTNATPSTARRFAAVAPRREQTRHDGRLMSEQGPRPYPRQLSFAGTARVPMMSCAASNVPDSQPNVMVADNDPGVRRMVSDYLGQNNMRVARATGKQDISRLLAAERFSMVILDLQLGQQDGLGLLRELRARSDLPVITLAGRHDEIDRIVSLELGADDCLAKPFSLRELLARIRVVLRRVETVPGEGTREPARAKGPIRLRFGRWTLDRRTRQFTDAEGAPIALTKGEYALLLAFLDAPQRPLSREHLLQAMHVNEDIFDRSIDVQILQLRRKLKTDPGTPDVIRTERGIGYVFTLPVAAI